MIRFLSLLLCLVTFLWGCQRTTNVILPPEPSTLPTSGSSTVTGPTEAATQPSTMAAVPGTEAPTTAATEATVSPTTVPTAAPTAEPTAAPTTEPTAAPVVEPTTAPTTEPAERVHSVYDISGHSIGSLEYGLLDAINRQRISEGLPALTMDPTLCALGAIRANECAESFSHTRPDGRGAFTVLSDYGYYIWPQLNERIHYGSSSLSAESVVKGWMYTTDFSASILSGDFTHIGIGICENGGTTYIVCFFAG